MSSVLSAGDCSHHSVIMKQAADVPLLSGSDVMKRGTLFLLILFVLVFRESVSLAGQNAVAPDPLDASLTAWRNGDVSTAKELLSRLAAEGSEDARVFYYRGILLEQFGEDGGNDFQMGAKLETQFSTTSLVNRALEKIQGPVRLKIQKTRIAARNAIKADPETARLKVVYRDALELRRKGNLAGAIELLKETTAGGSDPRYFYMYGVTLAENGQTDDAKAAFAEGLKREQTTGDAHLVSIALSEVQGEIRRMIEEQTQIDRGGELVTRQTNNRENQRRALMSQDQLLADANAAAEAVLEQQQSREEARTQAAADAILAENKAREDLENKINERPSVVAAVEPKAANPDPDAPMPADKEMTDALASNKSDAPTNPFLNGSKGAAASSLTAGPIDMAWLPADTDYLMYARPADLLNSGFMKPVIGTPEFEESMSKLTAQSGILPTDLESVTLGVGNAMGMLLPMVAQMGSGQPMDPASASQQFMKANNSMMVIRTNKPLDIAQLMSATGATESTQDEKVYYLLKAVEPAGPPAPANAPPQPPMALFPVDESTFLLSTEAAIQAAIPNGPGESASAGFGFVSSANHMVLAFSSPLLAAMSGSIPEPQGAPPQVAAFLAAIKGNVSGAALQFEAGADLKVNISLNLTEASAATEANAALQQGVIMAKQMAPILLGQAPPEVQPSLQQAVGSLSSNADKTLVTA
ncbi:MAG: hypothetical protein DWH78_01730, partial [Planctomycetota bacterium]